MTQRAASPGLWRPAAVTAVGLMLGLLLPLGHGGAQAQTQAQPATAEIYTCTDARGRKLTSDRPIAECRDREQKILNPSGTVKAHIGPTLTTLERREMEAKAKAQQLQQALLEEEKRRDRALLVRYPTPAVHDKERDAALDHISRVKQTALTQVTDLLAQKDRLMDEMDFYAKDPSKAPRKLKRQIEEVNHTLAAQGRFMADKDAEASRVNARFDAEQARLAPLWRMAAAPATGAGAGPAKLD